MKVRWAKEPDFPREVCCEMQHEIKELWWEGSFKQA
jgi:hypothetical protein